MKTQNTIHEDPFFKNKVGELTDTIKIDFDSIPDYVRDDLAAATLKAVNSFLRAKREAASQ